ncbi:MAG: ubiquitin-conjugating enzyme E2 [Pirellulales bacterium]
MADELAGRTGTCRSCGIHLQIPHTVAATKIVVKLASPAKRKLPIAELPVLGPLPVPHQKLPPRTRRLVAEAEQVRAAFGDSPFIRIESTDGDPPETYVVRYCVRGLARGPLGAPVFRDDHAAEIRLTRDYPRQGPQCRMLTPIFHPNIEPAMICIGDHWTAGERLVELICRIAEMVAYQAYNIKSPLDGEAAMWADQNQGHLPLDKRDLRPPDLE